MDALQNQKEFLKVHYFDIDNCTQEERIKHTREYVLGLMGELAEFQDGTKILPWKKQTELDYDNIREELVDIYHFFMNLCLLWGIDSENDLRKKYFEKNRKNYLRGEIHDKPTVDFKFSDNS